MKNKEPLRGLNLALAGTHQGPKGSRQTTLRFPPSPIIPPRAVTTVAMVAVATTAPRRRNLRKGPR